MKAILLLALIVLSAGDQSLAFQHSGTPDLIILDIEYAVQAPEPRGPVTPGTPARAMMSPVMGELAVTIGNIGTAELRNSFEVSWEAQGSDYYHPRTSGSSRVNNEHAVLPIGGFLVVHLRSYDFKPGMAIILYLQSVGRRYDNSVIPAIDELNFENNTFEFIIPKR